MDEKQLLEALEAYINAQVDKRIKEHTDKFEERVQKAVTYIVDSEMQIGKAARRIENLYMGSGKNLYIVEDGSIYKLVKVEKNG